MTGDDSVGASAQLPFRPRVAAASLSGESDADWARNAAPHVGAAFLGGIALDEPTREAARKLVARGRDEFLPTDPLAFLDEQLAVLADTPILAGFNVRAASPNPVREAARICRDRGAILEVNAHCRQDEMCAAGAGESLLHDADRLCEQVRAAAETDAIVSVKVRTEVDGVDLPETAGRLAAAGAGLIHVDAMDSEPVIAEVVEAVGGDPARGSPEGNRRPDGREAFVVANNEVRDRASVREYLEYGADAVSVGRPSDDPATLELVREATEEWFAEVPV